MTSGLQRGDGINWTGRYPSFSWIAHESSPFSRIPSAQEPFDVIMAPHQADYVNHYHADKMERFYKLLFHTQNGRLLDVFYDHQNAADILQSRQSQVPYEPPKPTDISGELLLLDPFLENLRSETGLSIIEIEEGGITVTLPNILFETGESKLKGDSKAPLKEIANILNNVEIKCVRIEGHTDEKGSKQLNQELSLARAKYVAEELNKLGVNKDSLEVKGYGEGRPIASNSSTQGRQKNRRVEIIIQR
jgi:outer membrane protein OmpA-like peptidoglycan-associated protein